MTSPAERIDVRCPACATVYETWRRASINTDLDPALADPAYLEEATTGTCPACEHRVNLGALIVHGDTWQVR